LTLDELRKDKGEAERLLRDDFLKKSLDRMRADYTALWMKARTVDERERLHIQVQLLDDLVHAIAWPIRELTVQESKSARAIREQTTGEPV
jgi:hypothetical protein